MLNVDRKILSIAFSLALLSACDTLQFDPADAIGERPVDGRHLAAPEAAPESNIPNIVRPLPAVTAPQSEAPLALYSVVVQDVEVRQLLFAMARDADINIDVHSAVTGSVSLNAIDQTLPQILDRLARQVSIVWDFEREDYLTVEADLPELRNYRIDYVNVARNAQSTVAVASGVGGDETNTSTSTLSQVSNNDFWQMLESNLATILGESAEGDSSSSIIMSPESGLVTVRATNRQHEDVFTFIETVRTRALYQVLIEATIVEVNLNDRFQSGVDWSLLARDNGQVSFTQDLLGLNLASTPTNVLTIDKSAGPDAITSTVRLLSQFGETKVLSSPKIMALNNQTAMLRVVDSRIYFTISVEPGVAASAAGPGTPTVFTSEVHSVPIGFTMAVTPQISENDQVTLNVRPTISRIIRFVNDPNPALAQENVINQIPEVQIREIESILKVESGQIAILGGLMQDTVENSNSGLPGLNRLPIVGNLFSQKDENLVKTELIIFIRPVVIRQPSIEGDFENFREYLPTASNSDTSRNARLAF
ncbi:MAG: type II and III secretion system protein [SAR86 cluster bacterium]|uniref:Type II and III secretion system protein n=1 Tax=SAR86 cluster bacterium TaxID=2030880 RepID=A0A2A4XIX4_9GAMM|nr:MAG: type II and III secretion system protein [SAR86 cluster bacterium]